MLASEVAREDESCAVDNNEHYDQPFWNLQAQQKRRPKPEPNSYLHLLNMIFDVIAREEQVKSVCARAQANSA